MAPPTPAVAALVRAGVTHSVHRYDHDPAATSYGQEAADALAVAPERIFKTLIVSDGARLLVAVVPVSGALDLKAFATAAGVKRASMADATAAERSTGYVLGGISPLGQKHALTTVVDETASRWPTIFVSGGRRGLELELAPDDLLATTRARYAPIGRTEPGSG